MLKEYVKIIRIDDYGFNCKPYTSNSFNINPKLRGFHHSFEFINSEITDLLDISKTFEKSKLHKPAENDWNWSGCFCHLEEYDKQLFTDIGSMAMKKNHKINIAYLHKDAKIWVRNINHNEEIFYNSFLIRNNHDGQEYWREEDYSRFYNLRWVRMSVHLALERTRLWKYQNQGKPVPEHISEFFLMENKLKDLKSPPFFEKLSYSIRNLVRF